MLKQLPLTFFLLFTLLAARAQSWHPFPFQGPYHYTFQNTNFWPEDRVYSLQVDSVTFNGSDSVYWFNRIGRSIVNEILLDCDSFQVYGEYQLDRDNIFGEKMVAHANGEMVFISTEGDTVFLQTNAQTGVSWNFQPDSGITAVRSGTSQMAILGVMDSVQTINLSNGQQILLSKSHGFVQVPEFYRLKFWGSPLLNPLTLWGIPSQGLGRHLPDFDDIFRVEVGDIFQTQGHYYDTFFQSGSTNLNEYRITGFSISPDSGQITWNYTKETVIITNPPFGPVDSAYYSPITGSKTFERIDYPEFDLLSYQGSITFGLANWLTLPAALSPDLNGRVSREYEGYQLYDSCSHSLWNFEYAGSRSYATGLGRIFWADNFVEYYESELLTCYRKSTDSLLPCPDLSTLVGRDKVVEADDFILFPNPTAGQIHLQGLPSPGGQIRMLTPTGQEILRQFFTAPSLSLEFPPGQLPGGIYLLEVESAGTRSIRKFVVSR
ncbi:MAG: T9SS type A sorting domain-containing protein [Bacteroidia bacterium]|nr:T9SS type A sorting domain-containing protein [Bacteroidia bacterium]